MGGIYIKEVDVHKQKINIVKVSTGFLIFFLMISMLFSQNNSQEMDELKADALKVYLDCGGCDRDYTRNEINFVNYVRDRQEADIHIFVTTLNTGSAGREYSIEFIGQKKYQHLRFTLKYFSNRVDTSDDTRKGLVRVLKKGLMPFISDTPLEEHISVQFEKKEDVKPTVVTDKWDSWIFSLGMNTSMSGEKLYRYSNMSGSFSINRTTPELKISTSFRANMSSSYFEIGDTTIDTSTKRLRFGSLVVKSISDHWSVGGWLNAASSTYSNEKYSFSATPALEYNVFPYSQSTKKQLNFLYRIGVRHIAYIEETIYDKMAETLFNESLSVTLRIKQPWGTASASLLGSHYFHDFSKNRFSVYGSISVRLWKGFSVNGNGSFAMIHDQLSLVKGTLTHEDILLRLREISTTYHYRFSIGVGYTFGSVYSNVVNPRFGSGGMY